MRYAERVGLEHQRAFHRDDKLLFAVFLFHTDLGAWNLFQLLFLLVEVIPDTGAGRRADRRTNTRAASPVATVNQGSRAGSNQSSDKRPLRRASLHDLAAGNHHSRQNHTRNNPR